MNSRMLHALRLVLFSLTLAAVAGDSLAESVSETKIVSGIKFHVGVLPSENVREHPKDHSESTMHGGASARSDQYHVVVALFDAATEQRIADAEVSARVGPLGMSAQQKQLQAMPIAGAASYGNYFDMPGKGPYRILIQVRRPGVPGTVEASFDHRH